MIGGSKWYKSRKRHITTADASWSVILNEESQKYRKTKQKGRNGFALLGRISIDQKMHCIFLFGQAMRYKSSQDW